MANKLAAPQPSLTLPIALKKTKQRVREGSNFPSKFDWVVIMMGYESGLINGVVIGIN